jgi:hypothetical protein
MKKYSSHNYDWNEEILYSKNEIIVIKTGGVYEIFYKKDLRKLKIEEILKDKDDV